MGSGLLVNQFQIYFNGKVPHDPEIYDPINFMSSYCKFEHSTTWPEWLFQCLMFILCLPSRNRNVL